MTNLEALIATLPFTVPDASLTKALIDAGIVGSATYVAGNLQALDMVAIELGGWILASPDIAEGDYSIRYDRGALLIWLNNLKGKYGLLAVPTIKGVHVW